MTRKLDIQRKKDEEDYYAPDSQVAAALDQVAKHRTDIFGIEETGVGRKIGEERKVANEIGIPTFVIVHIVVTLGKAKFANNDLALIFLLKWQYITCVNAIALNTRAVAMPQPAPP